MKISILSLDPFRMWMIMGCLPSFRGEGFYLERFNFMAWYHQYQFAEVTHENFKHLKGKSLPIIQYEIIEEEKKILSVRVKTSEISSEWFNRKYVRLFKGPKELIIVPDQRHTEHLFQRLKRMFNFK